MSHTPGPWKVVCDDLNEPWKQDVCTDRDNECVMIANVRVAPPVGETEDNAKLIAAAPELLQACNLALSTLSSYQQVLITAGNKPFAVPDWILNSLKAAIAKAEND